MKSKLVGIWNFYRDGFRSMTVGRTLWLIILIKLFILFFVLKICFFPNFLATHSKNDDKGSYVSNELIQRALPTHSTHP